MAPGYVRDYIFFNFDKLDLKKLNMNYREKKTIFKLNFDMLISMTFIQTVVTNCT